MAVQVLKLQRPAHMGGGKAAQMPQTDALAVECIHGRGVNTAGAAEKGLGGHRQRTAAGRQRHLRSRSSPGSNLYFHFQIQ